MAAAYIYLRFLKKAYKEGIKQLAVAEQSLNQILFLAVLLKPLKMQPLYT